MNAAHNKEFKPSKSTLKTWREEIMGSDLRGVNAMLISEITSIPRPTVVRKLKWLIENKFLYINKKKLISLDIKDSSFKKSAKLQEMNMLSLSHLIYRLFKIAKRFSKTFGEMLDSYIVHFPKEDLKRLVYCTEIDECL